jgi:hypothetical protein
VGAAGLSLQALNPSAKGTASSAIVLFIVHLPGGILAPLGAEPALMSSSA